MALSFQSSIMHNLLTQRSQQTFNLGGKNKCVVILSNGIYTYYGIKHFMALMNLRFTLKR